MHQRRGAGGRSVGATVRRTRRQRRRGCSFNCQQDSHNEEIENNEMERNIKSNSHTASARARRTRCRCGCVNDAGRRCVARVAPGADSVAVRRATLLARRLLGDVNASVARWARILGAATESALAGARGPLASGRARAALTARSSSGAIDSTRRTVSVPLAMSNPSASPTAAARRVRSARNRSALSLVFVQ